MNKYYNVDYFILLLCMFERSLVSLNLNFFCNVVMSVFQCPCSIAVFLPWVTIIGKCVPGKGNGGSILHLLFPLIFTVYVKSYL